jgi:hypothetical protein
MGNLVKLVIRKVREDELEKNYLNSERVGFIPYATELEYEI